MLTGIRIKNLCCFDDQNYNVKFNKLSILVGPNNSGKSTIFRALNLLRWFTATRNLQWDTQYYSLESSRDAFYNHNDSVRMELEMYYRKGTEDYQAELDITGNAISGNSVKIRDRHLSGLDVYSKNQEFVKEIWYFSPNRTLVPYRIGVGGTGDQLQPLFPSGNNINQFLIQRWTDQDPNWDLGQEWFKKFDPQMLLLKTPLISTEVHLETQRNDGQSETSVNLSLQGNGLQNLATIISAIIFSPRNNTIIIEEPENYLNSRSIEILVDLFNYAVNELDKQIIITTHSWEIINAYCSDIGEGTDRGNIHVKAKPEDFKLIVFNEELGPDKIQEYDLQGKKYADVRKYFKDLLG